MTVPPPNAATDEQAAYVPLVSKIFGSTTDAASGAHRRTATIWPSPLRAKSSELPFPGTRMPKTLMGYIWRVSAWDQLWLASLGVAVAVLGTAPIEFQRQITNEAIKHKNWNAIYTLALIYAGLVVAHGLLKLLHNLYKSWVGANATRLLRTAISNLAHGKDEDEEIADTQGVKISMIVSESDAVGGFTGDIISEPVLQGGILLTVFGYMLLLQPTMALVSLVIFVPQVVFVPIMQRAINRRVEGRITTLRQAGADVLADEADAKQAMLTHAGRFLEVFKLDMGIFKLKFTLNLLMNVSQHFGTVIILALGAWFVIEGQTQIGTVVAFLSGLGHITDPWGAVVAWFQTLMVTGAKYNLVRDAVAKLADPQETPSRGDETTNKEMTATVAA